MLLNYKAKDLVYVDIEPKVFKFDKFATFINGKNIGEISEAIETAIYHIGRNGNAKIILTDLSIKLTRYLHKK